MLEFVKYQDRSQYPDREFPTLCDYFTMLKDMLKKAGQIPSILAVVAVFPTKPSTKDPRKITFYAFSNNETPYGAINELSGIFGDFYGKTDVLPCIDPILLSDLNQVSCLPSYLRRKLKTRGAILYGT